jgi:hypothetical protein
LHLAPDIQERLLFLPPVVKGRDQVTERHLRAAVAVASWNEQRSIARLATASERAL